MALRNTAVLSLLPFGSRGMFGPNARLFDKTGEGDPGGTGDDAGAGDEKPLTAKEVTALIGQTVNQALSSKLTKAVSTAVAAALGPAIDGIKAEFAKAKPGAADDDEGGAGNGTPPKPKKGDPETEALRTELNALKANQQKIIDDAKKATEAAREKQALGLLLTELGEVTSSPIVAQTVAKTMLKVDGRIEFDAETGEPSFKHSRPAYAGGPPEEVLLTIKDGIQQWAKTEDAKPFLRAPTSGGGNGKTVGGGFGKSRTVTGGNTPKLDDPGGLEHAEADITAAVEAKFGRQE
jgi:hypothetical protein